VNTAQPILIVDDNPEDRVVLRRILRSCGYSVVESDTGKAAQAEVARVSPAAIFLDYRLPDMTGIEWLERTPGAANVPVILLTGTGERLAELGPAAIRAGADDFVPKDEVTAPLLERMLRHAEERRRLLAKVRDEQKHLAGVTSDISEREQEEAAREVLLSLRQQARREAEAANRAKDEFLAIVSHELRSPLNVILGWVSILRKEDLATERMRRGVDTIQRSTESLAQIVDDLLDVSRIVSDKLKLEAELVDLSAVAQTAVDNARLAADAKGLRLEASIAPARGSVRGDAGRLLQIIANLLANAVKFTPRGGEVRLSVTEEGGEARVVVSDTGAGIAPELLPHVFERFCQADNSSTRAHGGLGLGLAIVKHLTDLHGGRIHVESAGLGHGATFTLDFPLCAARAPARVLPPAGGAGSRDLRGVSVLLVEDDKDTRDAVLLALESSGACVWGADSARAAREVLAQKSPDVLVSDIGMPMEDGCEMLAKIRRQGGAYLPAVAMTGFASTQDRERAAKAGFDAHIAKPVSPEVLTERLLQLLSAAR
jgi:signal transduction histidine kinase